MTNVLIINMTIIPILILCLRFLYSLISSVAQLCPIFIDTLTKMPDWGSPRLLNALLAFSDLGGADETRH